MRKDVNRLRPSRWKKGQVGSTEDYRLARCVYRASLVRARFEHIRNLLTERRDPDIFRLVEKLESKQTLPSMVGTDGTLATSHADISDLIAQQLSPGEPTAWSTTEVDMEPAQDVAERLGVSERWVHDHATRRSPRIPVVKLGPLLRFRAEDIEDFLHCQLVATSSKEALDGV